MLKVTYTEQEAQAALALYDAAVKAVGIQAAEAAVVLSKKLAQAKAVAEAEAAEAAKPEAPAE